MLTVTKIIRPNAADVCAEICDLFSRTDKLVVDAVAVLVDKGDSCQSTLHSILPNAHHLAIHGQGLCGAGMERTRHTFLFAKSLTTKSRSHKNGPPL